LATFIKIKGENSLKESREEEEKNNEMNEEEKNSAWFIVNILNVI